MTRISSTFLAIVLVQAAHSVEEYAGRLFEVFPPARAVSGMISSNLRSGFVIANVALVSFGVLCFVILLRVGAARAAGLLWLWVGIELLNGLGHPLWSLIRGGYTPGVATAPILFVLALYLASQLRD